MNKMSTTLYDKPHSEICRNCKFSMEVNESDYYICYIYSKNNNGKNCDDFKAKLGKTVSLKELYFNFRHDDTGFVDALIKNGVIEKRYSYNVDVIKSFCMLEFENNSKDKFIAEQTLEVLYRQIFINYFCDEKDVVSFSTDNYIENSLLMSTGVLEYSHFKDYVFSLLANAMNLKIKMHKML